MTLWLSNLAAYSVQLAVLVATAAFVTWLLDFHQPRPALAFWRALLAIGLILPAIQPWSGTTPDLIISTLSRTASVIPAQGLDAPGISVATVLATFLAAGLLLRVAWLGLGLLRLRQIRARAESASDMAEMFDGLTTRLNARAELRISDDVDGPATVGTRSPVVLLPRRALDLSSAVQRAILCHELVHVRRRDWLSTLAEELVCAVLWFHPAARVLTSRICLARETLVDQQALALTGDRRAYAEALLAFSDPQPRLVAATPFVRLRHLAQRVALIKKEVSMPPRRIVSLTLVACTVVLLATGVAVAQFPIATTLAAQTGSDVTLPQVIKRVTPSYTKTAQDKRIQGSVWLSVVVTETGEVGDVAVTRSLDSRYGLDEEAIKAARQWKFEPGKKDGKAVAVQVTLELTFILK